MAQPTASSSVTTFLFISSFSSLWISRIFGLDKGGAREKSWEMYNKRRAMAPFMNDILTSPMELIPTVPQIFCLARNGVGFVSIKVTHLH
jgi:hypothetical protein